MSATFFSSSAESVDSAIARFLFERTETRGVEAYAWLVSVLRSAPGAESQVFRCHEAEGVVTTCAGQSVIHSLTGDNDVDRAAIIDYAKETHESTTIRGLALPGDRRTKNLFEEARLPAQVLVH